MLIFFQIFNNGCPLFFVSVTLFSFFFSLQELFKYPVSVFCLFLCIFHMDGAVKFKRKKKRRKKVQTYTCISIWMEAWRLIKLHFVWKTAVWGCCCVPRGWMECALGDSLWHPSARLAFCGARKPDATRRRGVSTAAQSAKFTPSTSEHRPKKKTNQPKMQRKKTTLLTKSCIMGFDFQVERMEKVKKFSLLFSLTCLFKHKLGRAQQKSATRHVTFPSIVVSDVRMRAARCRSRNCLWTRTCSGWVTDQILFVFVISN